MCASEGWVLRSGNFSNRSKLSKIAFDSNSRHIDHFLKLQPKTAPSGIPPLSLAEEQ